MAKKTRPRKRGDPEIEARLLECFRRGSPVSLACLASGISPAQFYVWQNQDEGFAIRVKQARGEYAQECLENIRMAGMNGSWQASMTWLERQFSEEFGRKERIQAEVSGPEGGPIVIDVPEDATPIEIAEAMDKAVKAAERAERARDVED